MRNQARAKRLARQIPLIQMGTLDRRLNYIQLLQPSALGLVPFSDKAATRRASYGGCRFPFLAEGLFPFWYLAQRSDEGRDDLRDVFKGGQRFSNLPTALHSIYFRIQSTHFAFCNQTHHHHNYNAVHSRSCRPLGFRSVAFIATRFDWRSLTSLIVLAAASTLASPIPAGSFSKKEVDAVEYNILAREPEVQGSDLDILAREPEIVEARDPICNPRSCS